MGYSYLAAILLRPLPADKAALFLASDDSTFMTGATLVVDGKGTAD